MGKGFNIREGGSQMQTPDPFCFVLHRVIETRPTLLTWLRQQRRLKTCSR